MDNSKAVLGASVDRLAVLLASINELTTEADAIKSALIVAGPDVIEGSLHRATIVHSIRESLDSDKVRKFLTPAQLVKCVRHSPTHRVCVTSR